MRIVCHAQKTSDGIPLAAWIHARLGIVPGSRVAEAMGTLQKASKNGKAGDFNAEHWNLVRELAWEHITGVPFNHYVSKPMERGAMYEGEARIEFWMRHSQEVEGAEVEETGFILHPTMDYLGSSPDGLVHEHGIIVPAEFKVPELHTHMKYLEDDVVPQIYVPQMQTQMMCCDFAPYGYFASFAPPDLYPDLPEEFRLFTKRLEFNREFRLVKDGPTIEEAATLTMGHVAERLEKIRAMYPSKGAPKKEFVQSLEAAVLAQEISMEGGLTEADFVGLV